MADRKPEESRQILDLDAVLKDAGVGYDFYSEMSKTLDDWLRGSPNRESQLQNMVRTSLLTLSGSPEERRRYRELASDDIFPGTVWRNYVDQVNGREIRSVMDDIIAAAAMDYAIFAAEGGQDKGEIRRMASQPIVQALDLRSSGYRLPSIITKRLGDHAKAYDAYKAAVTPPSETPSNPDKTLIKK